MADHRTLLAEYAAHDSETAFRELVASYIDLVYSTALRLVDGDAHRAEDVAQTVFADLARLAGTLSKDVMLGGWLHRRTCHVAATIMRSERRRQHRERQALEMNTLQDQPESRFEQIAPLLDEAIDQLNARDRAAIVLRFFEHRDLRAVGEALGSNEDAAQKRVSRAVEKLRGHFARRGIAVPAAVIAALTAEYAVQAAPASLAATVATASLAGVAGAGSLGLAATTTKILLMKKSTGIALAVTALAAVVVVAPLTAAKIKQARANAPVTDKSLRQGLVLHLTFDQDEAGGKMTDTSGRGNDGRATGVRWTMNGKKNGAYEFTADGDQVEVSNHESLNPGQLTLAAWIKSSYADGLWRRIFDKSYSRGYALSIAGDWQQNKWRGLASMEIGPGTHFILTKSKVTDGEWHQVVMTFDGTEELLYVDGQLQSKLHWAKPGRAGATDFNLVIGCNRSNLNEEDLGKSFRGLIDEPMMWNRALADKEVAFLFESQK